jgi:transcriptional regulator with XRE-family HTH domain
MVAACVGGRGFANSGSQVPSISRCYAQVPLTMKSPKAPDAVDVQVGQRIRVQRLAMRMTQHALGDALGVTVQQVQKYEKGVSRVGAGRLAKTAKVLRVPVANLLGADKDTGPADSALGLLGRRGALRLLRAFSKLSDDKMRRSVVQLVERIAAGPR